MRTRIAEIRERTRILAACPLRFDAAADAARYTALGAAVLQTLNHVVNAKTVAAEVSADKAPVRRQSSVTPGHLVLIQAESFAPVSLYLNRPSVTPMLTPKSTSVPGAMVTAVTLVIKVSKV